jgi:hypothetical protein
VLSRRAPRKQVACPTCGAPVRIRHAGGYFAVREERMTMVENGKIVHACDLPPQRLPR